MTSIVKIRISTLCLFVFALIPILYASFFLYVDHTRAPDHYAYWFNSTPFQFHVARNYVATWSDLIVLFKWMGLQIYTPFYFGFLCYFISVYLIGRIFLEGYRGNVLGIFYFTSFVDYSAIAAFSIDKSSVVGVFFWLVVFFYKFELNYIRALIISVSLICVLYLRAWLLLPLGIVIYNLKGQFIIALLTLAAYFSAVVLFSIDIFNFQIIEKTLFNILFLVVDPLPKETDKFFGGGINYFLLLCLISKTSVLLGCLIYLICNDSRFNLLLLLNKFMLPGLMLLLLIATLASYFDPNFLTAGVGIDAVRKSLFFSPVFWAVFLSCLPHLKR